MKKGNIVRMVQYLEVTETNGADTQIHVNDLNRGIDDITISGASLVRSLDSADEFSSTEKLTKTQLADKFGEVGDNVFTVEFEKQNGSLRKLRGYMITRETGMGRSQVVDLDIERGKGDYDNRLRQVDHRTLKSLIFDGVKYVKK
jgi:hypothetical protein